MKKTTILIVSIIVLSYAGYGVYYHNYESTRMKYAIDIPEISLTQKLLYSNLEAIRETADILKSEREILPYLNGKDRICADSLINDWKAELNILHKKTDSLELELKKY